MNIRASSSKALKQANLQMLVHRHTAQLLNIERPGSSATRKKTRLLKKVKAFCETRRQKFILQRIELVVFKLYDGVRRPSTSRRIARAMDSRTRR